MKMQPKLIASALAALLAALGTAYAAENSGGGNPTSTPTWTVPVTQPSDITIKQKSSNVNGARGIEKKDIRRGMVIAKPTSAHARDVHQAPGECPPCGTLPRTSKPVPHD